MKKKAFLFLLLVPFLIAIFAFVTATYVIRSVETDITSITLDYEANTPFMLSEGKKLLKATANYDPNYPLSAGNELTWTSSEEDIAGIEKSGNEFYLVPKKEGSSVITCQNAKGNVSSSFTAVVVGSGGAIIVNSDIPFSSSKINGTNYVGLYDTKEAYDSKGDSYRNSDASLKLNVQLVGTSFAMEGVTIETSDNVTYNKETSIVTFNNVGEAYVNFINPYSETGSSYFNFTLVDAINVYDYDDLISLTNKASRPYKLVLRKNLESLQNTYIFDENGEITGVKSKDTALFGRLDENNEVESFEDDIYSFETTYNHDFLNKWNDEVEQGLHEGEDKTRINVYAGIHIQDDFYGNGFTINTHELTFPSDTQTITVNGESTIVAYLTPADLYSGPLHFVTLGNPNYSMSTTKPMYTLYGQDNSAFYIDNDNLDLIDVHFKNCDFGNNLSNLEYVGTTLDINADNVTIKDSIIENGRNVVRTYSSHNLLIENSLLQNSMEFLLRSGSNEYNHVNYDESVNYFGENGRKLISNKSSYLAQFSGGSDMSSLMQKSYKADSMLTFSAIYNTQAGEFLGLTDPGYTKEEFIEFKDIITKALTNENGFYDENGNKNYAGETTLKDVYFASSGISAISLDSLPQGSFLENNTTSVFGILLGAYMDGASPHNMALTGYPTKVTISGDTRFYDWKNKDNLTYQSLVGQDIASLIIAHGGLGSDFKVEITEDDYLPIKKLLLDNYSDVLLNDGAINLPVYIQGGGYNISDIVFNENFKDILTDDIILDPFTYSLSLSAYHSDHFDTDPRAKYETMKVAMQRASSNVLGFNNYKIYGIKGSEGTWKNESPSISDLISRSNQ